MSDKIIIRNKLKQMLGQTIKVYIDRPIGSKHPHHKDIIYKLNYGYIKEIIAEDNEFQDAYVLGIDKPIKSCIGKVYAPDEFDKNEWTIYGEPDTTVVITRPATVELTCATIVNRIPDVINARPGFVPTSEMPILQYRTKALDEYLNK